MTEIIYYGDKTVEILDNPPSRKKAPSPDTLVEIGNSLLYQFSWRGYDAPNSTRIDVHCAAFRDVVSKEYPGIPVEVLSEFDRPMPPTTQRLKERYPEDNIHGFITIRDELVAFMLRKENGMVEWVLPTSPPFAVFDPKAGYLPEDRSSVLLRMSPIARLSGTEDWGGRIPNPSGDNTRGPHACKYCGETTTRPSPGCSKHPWGNPSGRADGMIPDDFDAQQLEVGTDVELEHTTDRGLAQEIAMDHLAEHADYYKELATFTEEETA